MIVVVIRMTILVTVTTVVMVMKELKMRMEVMVVMVVMSMMNMDQQDSRRGEICHCRHCRRQCNFFGNGVNFSIFTHFFVLLSPKLLKFGKIKGVNFLA